MIQIVLLRIRHIRFGSFHPFEDLQLPHFDPRFMMMKFLILRLEPATPVLLSCCPAPLLLRPHKMNSIGKKSDQFKPSLFPVIKPAIVVVRRFMFDSLLPLYTNTKHVVYLSKHWMAFKHALYANIKPI